MDGATLRFRLQGMTSAAATAAILLLHNFTAARAAAPGGAGAQTLPRGRPTPIPTAATTHD
jgi:hypothetical protein